MLREEVKYASKDYVNYLLDKQEYHNEKYTEHDIKQAFEKGAEWADENPNSKTIKRIGDKAMINRIKEKIINELKDEFYYDDSFNIPDIERIVNKIPESDFTPKFIERDIDADEDKLFDKNVSNVINYLSLYKDYKLCQRWNGYEDNYFVFSKKFVETEDEIFNRLFIDIKNKYEKLLENKNELEENKNYKTK